MGALAETLCGGPALGAARFLIAFGGQSLGGQRPSQRSMHTGFLRSSFHGAAQFGETLMHHVDKTHCERQEAG